MLIDLDVERPDVMHRVETGLYVPIHWSYYELIENNDAWHQGHWDWPEFRSDNVDRRLRALREWWDSDHSFSEYGSCDNVEQFKTTDTYRGIVAAPWPLLVTFRLLKKSDERDGGYRWHKNGPYIGVLRQECEYLKDEPVIEEILQFGVHRRKA